MLCVSCALGWNSASDGHERWCLFVWEGVLGQPSGGVAAGVRMLRYCYYCCCCCYQPPPRRLEAPDESALELGRDLLQVHEVAVAAARARRLLELAAARVLQQKGTFAYPHEDNPPFQSVVQSGTGIDPPPVNLALWNPVAYVPAMRPRPERQPEALLSINSGQRARQ